MIAIEMTKMIRNNIAAPLSMYVCLSEWECRGAVWVSFYSGKAEEVWIVWIEGRVGEVEREHSARRFGGYQPPEQVGVWCGEFG